MRSSSRSGFTLIELLLYVTLAGVMLAAVSLLLAQSLSARARHQVVSEVTDQGASAMARIEQSVRDAVSITVPSSGTSSTLTLVMATGTSGPVVIDAPAGALRLTVASGTPQALTNSRVVISNLAFTAGGASTTPGSVTVAFTAAYATSSTLAVYQQSEPFRGGATVRYR